MSSTRPCLVHSDDEDRFALYNETNGCEPKASRRYLCLDFPRMDFPRMDYHPLIETIKKKMQLVRDVANTASAQHLTCDAVGSDQCLYLCHGYDTPVQERCQERCHTHDGC